MLTGDDMVGTAGADEAVRQLRLALDDFADDLRKLGRAVLAVQRRVRPRQDPISLDRIAGLVARGRVRADRSRGLLDGAVPARALPDIHHLIDETRAGLADASVDDVDRMLEEAEAARDAGTRRAVSALRSRIGSVRGKAHQFFEIATASQAEFADGAAAMSAEKGDKDSAAEAVRDLGEMLALTLAKPAAPAAARSTGRRFQAVADQLAASLDAFGLPHDGVQLPVDSDETAARERLISGLRRNFAARDVDGYRIYHRSAPQPAVRDPAADDRLLRGAALVNANLLRAEADGIIAILERLPDMVRFVRNNPLDQPEARRHIRDNLEQIIATARDPMGLNTARGKFQVTRLRVALAELLWRGEILPLSIANKLREPELGRDTLRAIAEGEPSLMDALRTSVGAVRDEEVLSEFRGLMGLLTRIDERFTSATKGKQIGRRAAKLEQLLTAAFDGATSLEANLAALGTSAVEQTVRLFEFDEDGSRTTPETDVSLAQFINWVRVVSEPFTLAGQRSAAMSTAEFRVLYKELGGLAACAVALRKAANEAAFGARIPGVRQQIDELRLMLDQASGCASELAGIQSSARPSGADPTPTTRPNAGGTR